MVTRFEWGIYCAEPPIRLGEVPGTADGRINIVPNLPRIVSTQTTVPAELGIAFDVLAAISPTAGIRSVDVTVTHPPYSESGITVERWVNIVDDEATSLFGFSFEEPEELVLGTWTIMAESGGEEEFPILFEVARPVMAA